jgi:flagellar motor switch protein FliN/FliY
MPDNLTAPPQEASPAVQTIDMSELETAAQPGSGRQDGVSPSSLGGKGELSSALRGVRVKLRVCVGTAELTIGELLDAKEQQVFQLDRTVEEPVDVLLDGQVVARGTLVAVEERFAVRISEVPLVAEGGARKAPHSAARLA